ncbi:MAG: hypothetical protein ACI81I_000833 [Arcobacteraceae bacterium]|jgi:hypothetical protein
MTLNNNIQEHVTRDSIVDMLTRYELYYQISLGNMKLQLDSDYNFIYDSYNQIITEEIALKIRNQIK